MTANIYGEDVEAIFVTQDGNDGDTDVLVNMSHLYGEDSGILGMGTDDVSGGNFDVVTSAKLDGFAGEDDLQIYYDGDHNAFVDSQDHMTWSTDEGTNVATSEVNTGNVPGQTRWRKMTLVGPQHRPSTWRLLVKRLQFTSTRRMPPLNGR